MQEHLDYHLDPMTKRIREIRRELIEHLEKKGIKDAGRKVFEACFEWARGIQGKYPKTYHLVRAYYGMVGGSAPPSLTQDDFEGEDSALLFLENLRKKLLGSE